MKDHIQVQKLDLLIALYIFCIAVAELMGAKTFPLFKIGTFQLNANVAIFVIPVLFSINDIVVEVFGKARARNIVRSGIVVIFLIFLFSIVAVHLPPSKRFELTESSYDVIFGISARIAAASLIAFSVADFMDIIIFSRIRKRLGAKALWFRNNVSNFISQFLDTTIFMFLAFYSINKNINENLIFLFGLILPYWLLKCSVSIVETPFVYMGVRWMKGEEKK